MSAFEELAHPEKFDRVESVEQVAKVIETTKESREPESQAKIEPNEDPVA